MRISRWPVLLCGWLLAVTGQTANAFYPADGYSYESPSSDAGGDEEEVFDGPSADYYEGEGGAGGLVYQPVQYLEDGYGGMPMHGGGDPYYMQGGYPPNAWPGVSPYSQHNMEGVYNDGGVWRYQANDDNRKHVFSTEFLLAWGLRPGSHIIGDPRYTNLTFSDGNNSDRADPGIAFPRQNTNQFSNLQHYGVKLRYGWENPDESGLILSGMYIAGNDAVKGPGDVFNGQYNTLQPIASIAYDTAAQDYLALFDESFSQTYDQELWGADADFYASPFFRRQSLKVAFTYGVKYLRLNETFAVRGSNSNFGYVVVGRDISEGTVVDNGLPRLNTEINASATSNLIGPQIGIRYDLGGEKFKIWGQTKVVVAANIEETKVFGRNAFANLLIDPAGSGGLAFNVPPPRNVPFSNRNSTTHISPILDQSIYGEFPLFSVLPIVNRMSFINKANFRVGYNFLLINEVQRPAAMIVYNSGDPGIRTHRSWFSLSTVSFAADWRF
jgi:hypothetical protein